MRSWDFRYVDPQQRSHHKVCLTKAFRYAKLMEEGAKFPPVQVHIDKNGRYIVRNGAHRTFAAKLCGMKVFIKVASQYYNYDEFEDLHEGKKKHQKGLR